MGADPRVEGGGVYYQTTTAQANGVVLLSPCLGGAVDKWSFPHASDIEEGKLDVYGQLGRDYVQQSAPHMRAIGKMIRRVLGVVQQARVALRLVS